MFFDTFTVSFVTAAFAVVTVVVGCVWDDILG